MINEAIIDKLNESEAILVYPLIQKNHFRITMKSEGEHDFFFIKVN